MTSIQPFGHWLDLVKCPNYGNECWEGITKFGAQMADMDFGSGYLIDHFFVSKSLNSKYCPNLSLIPLKVLLLLLRKLNFGEMPFWVTTDVGRIAKKGGQIGNCGYTVCKIQYCYSDFTWNQLLMIQKF